MCLKVNSDRLLGGCDAVSRLEVDRPDGGFRRLQASCLLNRPLARPSSSTSTLSDRSQFPEPTPEIRGWSEFRPIQAGAIMPFRLRKVPCNDLLCKRMNQTGEAPIDSRLVDSLINYMRRGGLTSRSVGTGNRNF